MKYSIWDIESVGTTKNESDIKYFGITDNVTSYGAMCGDKNVDANNYQIDFDKYPQSKNRIRTLHVRVTSD